MKIIGLTGKCCAGKNAAGALLEAWGYPVLDVDLLGHEALQAEREAVAERFGRDVLDGSGRVDRKLLGTKVFGQPAELAALEAIVHPAANTMTSEWIDRQLATGGPACVVNAALLHKSSAFSVLDALFIVTAPLPVRLLRARRRDGLPWRMVLERMWQQRNFDSQYSQSKADIYKVDNTSTLSALEAALREALERAGVR
jgi:dephospho-CoA kinase